MIANFLRWLFKRSKLKVSRDTTTKKFDDFEKYYRVEDVEKNIWKSHETFLIRYMLETGLSPFLGDENLQEARKLLKEQGIKIGLKTDAIIDPKNPCDKHKGGRS